MNRKFEVSYDSLMLFVTVVLLVLRDILNILLGHYVNTSNISWFYQRYEGSFTTYLIRIAIITMIVCALQSRKTNNLPRNLLVCFWTTGIITLFWTFHSLCSVTGYNIMYLGSTAKTIWICMFGLYIGYNNQLWEQIRRAIPVIAFILIGLSMAFVLISYITQGTGYSTQGQSPHWYLYSSGVWVFAYYLLCEKEKQSRKLTIILMVMNLVIIALSISRGWMIITFILYIYFFVSNTTMNKQEKRRFIGIFVILGVVGFLMFKDQIMYSILGFVEKFKSLYSRTSQFDALFSQVSLLEFIVGKGEFATYYYSFYGDYMYIDNSYLFYMFHFGLLFSLIQFFLPLIQGIRALKKRKKHTEGNTGFVLLLWIMACSGFSVYCAGYEVCFRLFFIMMLIGHLSRFINDTEYQERDSLVLKEIKI